MQGGLFQIHWLGIFCCGKQGILLSKRFYVVLKFSFKLFKLGFNYFDYKFISFLISFLSSFLEGGEFVVEVLILLLNFRWNVKTTTV